MAHDDLARKKTGQQGNRGADHDKGEIAQGAERERAEHGRDFLPAWRMRPPEGQKRGDGEEGDRRQPADQRAAKPQTTLRGLYMALDEGVRVTDQMEKP